LFKDYGSKTKHTSSRIIKVSNLHQINTTMNDNSKIAISGASGLIGSNLSAFYRAKNIQILQLGRHDFQLSSAELAQKLAGVDAIVHLAGAPVIRRWTSKHKKQIHDSRILTTRKLVEAMQLMPVKPGVFVSASAVGIYNEECVQDEYSNQFATDFLGKVCLDWEAEAENAASLTRLAIVRLGIVLAHDGGALKTMLTPFKLGIGGVIASGRQPFAWIHLQDVIRAIDFIIHQKEAKGVFNLVAPELVNNRSFTKSLAATLKRPAMFPVPAFALKLLYGEAASTLTGGQKVVPMRLEKAGFKFSFPKLEAALINLLSKD
jgi:uncharacterized protein